jgi:hypothetical protein
VRNAERSYSIIGEEKTVSVKVGKDAKHADGEDFILVRGQVSEVDRAVKEINKIVQDAKDDVILSGYVCHFLLIALLRLLTVSAVDSI